jgi:predicted MFS family arabinose efflux permease
VARWFKGRRGLMTGIVSGGIGFGTMLSPPILTQLIDAYDWRLTYVIVSAATLVVVIIVSQFIKIGPAPEERLSEDRTGSQKITASHDHGFPLSKAIKSRQFWMVSFIYFCFGFVQLTVMVHIVPYATGSGISSLSAAGVLSAIGGVSLAARIIMGIVTDRLRAKTSLVICLVLMAASMVVLLYSDNLTRLYLAAAVFGFSYGGLSCLQPLLAAELYGLLALGVITAIFGLSFDIGGAIGPVVAGHIFDIDQSYWWAFISCLALVAAALVVGIAIKMPKTK